MAYVRSSILNLTVHGGSRYFRYVRVDPCHLLLEGAGSAKRIRHMAFRRNLQYFGQIIDSYFMVYIVQNG